LDLEKMRAKVGSIPTPNLDRKLIASYRFIPV
jgi:hypothetical protein